MTASSSAADPTEGADRHICVIGMGYVGLPLAIDLVAAGFDVLAVDRSASVIERLRSGKSHVEDVPPSALSEASATGRLRFETTDRPWGDATVAFICVPTPVTASREPDLTPIRSAANYVRQSLNEGDLVVLQSTTYPGTTMGPLRTALEGDGREAGRDFGLAFSPERVSPGEGRPASTIPRLVGGIDRASTARTAAILQRISPSVIELSSPDAAELAKLFENVFRNVNIALVNELALICERLSLDVWEVIAGASTKPFGFMPFYPGPGVGGHCIPVDPYYLSARAREVGFHERFIETAGDINSRMPDHVVSLVTAALNARGIALARASILVLGVAFKAGVSDDRNSPAAGIIASLQARGADVSYHDPRLPAFDPSQTSSPVQGNPLRSTPFEEALAAKPDCVVIVTPHLEIDWDAVFERADLIVDTRNVSAGRTTRPGQVLRLGAGWS